MRPVPEDRPWPTIVACAQAVPTEPSEARRVDLGFVEPLPARSRPMNRSNARFISAAPLTKNRARWAPASSDVFRQLVEMPSGPFVSHPFSVASRYCHSPRWILFASMMLHFVWERQRSRLVLCHSAPSLEVVPEGAAESAG